MDNPIDYPGERIRIDGDTFTEIFIGVLDKDGRITRPPAEPTGDEACSFKAIGTQEMDAIFPVAG